MGSAMGSRAKYGDGSLSNKKGRIPITSQKIDALEGIIADRKKRLTDYQNAGYSAVYEEGLAYLAADFDPKKRLTKPLPDIYTR